MNIVRLLVPTDFSPAAERAYEWAAYMCDRFGASVVLLHVIDTTAAGAPASIDVATAAPMTVLETVGHEAEEALARVTARFPRTESLLRIGSAGSAILETAAEVGADMIVMGAHGRSGVARAVFGSVAEHVVRQSKIPVLTVPELSSSHT